MSDKFYEEHSDFPEAGNIRDDDSPDTTLIGLIIIGIIGLLIFISYSLSEQPGFLIILGAILFLWLLLPKKKKK